MTRLLIYSALALLIGVWVFSSISTVVRESPLGNTLEERKLKIEKQWEQ